LNILYHVPRYHHINEIFEYSLTNANILSISHVVVYMWRLQTTCIIEENFSMFETIEKTIIHPYNKNLSKKLNNYTSMKLL
jgi:hypothetical protein